MFASVFVLPVDNQRASHFGEQLEETLQEEADRKWERGLKTLKWNIWQISTRDETKNNLNKSLKTKKELIWRNALLNS